MKKEKTNIKNLPETEAIEEENNKAVFSLGCKNIVDQIKNALPQKNVSIKQVVTYALLTMEEADRREIIGLIRENKLYDKTVEGFIIAQKKDIVAFFQQQKNKESSVAYLKRRVAELEQQVEMGGDHE